MPRTGVARLLLLIGLAFAARPAHAQVSAADSAYLVATSQALLNGITDGDSAVWASQLAPNWILSDEEGNLNGRTEFLAGLHPLPAGQSGKITLSRWQLTGGPGVAVIAYDVDEEHHYYDQLLLTRFHITDTYVRSGDRWQQLASQVTALPRPIAGVPVQARLGREYAGTYQLTPEIRMTVVAGDSGLALARAGRPDQRLYALDDRLFIRHGVRGFWVFERDASGAVMTMVNWRDNNAVTWRKLQ
jgi:hypothetical protein